MLQNIIPLLAQDGGEGAAVFGLIFNLVLIVLMVASLWTINTKAGKPGWAAIVPIYNVIVLLEIVGRPLWWVVLMLIPCVGIIVAIVLAMDLAKSFGKGAGFGIGLVFLGFIFYPILAFGDAKYQGPSVVS